MELADVLFKKGLNNAQFLATLGRLACSLKSYKDFVTKLLKQLTLDQPILSKVLQVALYKSIYRFTFPIIGTNERGDLKISFNSSSDMFIIEITRPLYFSRHLMKSPLHVHGFICGLSYIPIY